MLTLEEYHAYMTGPGSFYRQNGDRFKGMDVMGPREERDYVRLVCGGSSDADPTTLYADGDRWFIVRKDGTRSHSMSIADANDVLLAEYPTNGGE